MSFWWKVGNLTDVTFLNAESGASSRWRYDTASQALQIYSVGDSSYVYTPSIYRDPSAWYHVLLVWDLSQDSGSRVKWYVNGVQQTVTLSTEPTSGSTYVINTAIAHEIGAREGSSIFMDGYLSQYCFIDNAAKAVTDFGEFDDNGVWRPIDITGLDYTGTNSFLLDFADSSNLGNDVSGNDNDWASSGLAADDQVTDTPTKNYAVLNSIQPIMGASAMTLSNGNLGAVGSAASHAVCYATIGALTSGKWIFCVKADGAPANVGNKLVITNTTGYNTDPANPASEANHWVGGFDSASAFDVRDETSDQAYSVSPAAATGDIILCAVDIGNLAVWFGYYDDSTDTTYWADAGSTFSGDPTDGGTTKSGTLVGTEFYFGTDGWTGKGGVFDFGQLSGQIDKIALPTDYKYLNTANLPTPTILDGTANFQTTLYTGNATDRNISQTGNSVFTPDWVWIKNRSAADGHKLIDAARGIAREINSDDGSIQNFNDASIDGLQAFSDKLWIDASGETLIGNMTGYGGLSAGWDGDNDKSWNQCPQTGTGTGYLGIDWGSGNTKTITQMITCGSNDYSYSNASETINIKLEGSTDNFSSSVVDLGGGTGDFTATNDPDFKIITPTSTTAFRYHRAKVTTSSGGLYFAQVQLFEDNTGDTRGFSLGNGPAGYNDNSENFVAWQWLAGGGAGSSNEVGSINTTTTTVNTTAGISISTYTGNASAGATIGHGLGVKPSWIFIKNLETAEYWTVYNIHLSAEKMLQLNTTGASSDTTLSFNDTEPTTTVITLGSDSSVNENTKSHVAYAFAEIEGFSKLGSYTGNGAADGPVVYTGFKPAYVMIKKTSGTGSWVIYDSQRSPYNEIDDQLLADTTAAETTGSEEIDFLSNGFKIRTADSDVNTSSGTYVYAAFAEYPFGGEDVTPATAF